MIRACLLALVAVLGTGCLTVNAVSSAPLAAEGSLDVERDVITLSRGVALGIDCHGTWGSPCEAAVASTDDPKIARVLPAHLEKFRSAWGNVYEQEASQTSAFVVAGVAPGRTLLHLQSEDGDRTFEVIVE